ncbi:MAG: hypothetical protein QOI95_2586 [Acidimicrobiaceae bacterium]|jgi:hypothetical protein
MVRANLAIREGPAGDGGENVFMTKVLRRLFLPGAFAALLLLVGSAPAANAKSVAHGDPIAVLAASTSSNWSGYNQGMLEAGKSAGFHQVSAQWVVPMATQHKRGRAEYSATWVGIGGGCLDTACNVTDATLIQAGSSQDVAANGKASYEVWYELIPGPSISISNVPVKAGDTVLVDIHEVIANTNVWIITVKNLTTGTTFTTTLPYSSTHATVEWIVETPLIIGTDGTGVAAMPNLANERFTGASVNGGNAGLVAAEQIVLEDGNGQRLATPSQPSGGNQFSVCTYTSTCAP